MGRSKVEAPAPAKISDAELEQIHEETRRLDVSEKIAYWDKRQAVPDTTVYCPNDRTHGAVAIVGHRSCVPGAIAGALLICGARKGGAFCTGTVPV